MQRNLIASGILLILLIITIGCSDPPMPTRNAPAPSDGASKPENTLKANGFTSKQIVYRGNDDHIYQLHASPGVVWWYNSDLTETFRTPRAITNPMGYDWKGRSRHVVYIGTDFHIYEFFSIEGGDWQVGDLTLLSGAPTSDNNRFPPVGYAWEAGKAKQVVYVGGNDHVYELFVRVGDSWQWADLTALTGVPVNPSSRVPLSAYSWEAGNSKQVTYLGTDDHIYELFVRGGGSWQWADLTALTNAPTPLWNSAPFGFAWETGNSKQVIYRGSDDHIYEMFVTKGDKWKFADLTKLTGAPKTGSFSTEPRFSSPRGWAWESEKMKQIVYRGKDNSIYTMFVSKGGKWTYVNLTKVSGAATLPACDPMGYAWESGAANEPLGTNQVVYRGTDGHVHQMANGRSRRWSDYDLTQLYGVPRPSFEFSLSGYSKEFP